MTTTQVQSPAIPSFDKVKMEDRKRSLAVADGEDLAPSRKRLHKDENGQQMRMDAEKEKEIENYQKDAILRQMKEYKRQRKDLEQQVTELQEKSQYHDDHLRTIDAWFAQLLDEVRVTARQMLPTPRSSAPSPIGEEMYRSALSFGNNVMFTEHLQARSVGIKSAISDLFGRLPVVSSDVQELQSRLNDLLAREKEHAIELRKVLDDKDALSERLEQASYRYMTAEKKLDRAKSAQVQKLERAAMMGGGVDVSAPAATRKAGTPKLEQSEMNGDHDSGVAVAEAEAARKEALAVAQRQKTQVEEIEAENERLTNELSAARTKLASLSDDDYAESSLCKTLKIQYADAVKRVNDLEATNIQLQEETRKFQAERTKYRIAVDEEQRASINEIETQIARAENDLTRIRAHRDELNAENAVRKTTDQTRKTASDQAKELAAARDSRITALESQVERLRMQLGEAAPPEVDLEGMDVEALKARLKTIEGQHALLSNELPSMEAAWKKTQVLASKKVEEVANWEEHIARLSAEKAKADQKYFGAMKTVDLQRLEIRALKQQNSGSSEIVAQLKETDGKTRELVATYEKQVAEAKDALHKVELLNRTQEQKVKEMSAMCEGFNKKVTELKGLIVAKDKDNLACSKSKREAEEELDKCKSRLEDIKKQYELLKKSRISASSNDSDDWRKVAICPVCNANIRNTAIKLCGHVFCSVCVKDLISNRSRKCPTCGKGFGNSDHMPIVLT